MSEEKIAKAFTPVIHMEDGRYWAEIPAMPGCITWGDSIEEVRAGIIEAAQSWLEAKLEWLMSRPLAKPSRRKRELATV